MDLMAELYLERANNEHLLAEAIKKISETDDVKKELRLPEKITFYSAAISHSHYAIFYSAKAALITKKIETKSPEIHKKTFEEFKKQFVESGILDTELLIIYKKMIIRADELLQIFKNGKEGILHT
ncbi:HEPN domain-containing protein, partial [Candidatus Woesearchaeota archaeon]|nr:HEPN domain-containing protein [Candidatus Woesearchaeota archaeon]